MKINEIKSAIKNRKVIKQAREMQDAVMHAGKTAMYNGVLITILKATWKELEKKGIKEVRYRWKGKKRVAKFKDEYKDFKQLEDEGHIVV